LVEGAGAGALPLVKVFDADTGTERFQFLAYDSRFRGGVRVAVGDVTGDGSLDIITAPGPGTPPFVKIFSSTNGALLGQFAVPRSLAHGGLWVAAGDVDGNGRADIVLAPGSGPPTVQVYAGPNGVLEKTIRIGGGTDGARVAVGDVNSDGHADIVTLAALGPPQVRVFDGSSGALLAHFEAFQVTPSGGASVALGDIRGTGSLQVIAAADISGTHTARVRAFQPLTGSVVSTFDVPLGAADAGVNVASINIGGRGADELALVPGSAHGLGAAILSSTPLRTGSAGLSATPLGAGTALDYRLPPLGLGATLAGDNSVAVSTPAFQANNLEPPLSQTLPIIDRFAYYDPTTHQFVPVSPNDPRLVGKDITVITHGWAPGYADWVNYEATQKDNVLKWWETVPGQPGYDPSWTAMHPNQGPDSDWMFQGLTVSTITGTTVVSAVGLAQSIVNRLNPATGAPADPNAAVIAYSWIDDSATPAWDFLHFQIPEDAYQSEALTTLNGERLASGLETILGSSASTDKIQLMGHSHGSKVVTVAALALQKAGIKVNQLTILDSPEDDVTVAGNAANFNWFFLNQMQNLNRSHTPNTFVDNYISEFGVPYSGITLSSGGTGNLNQVVDVNLYPYIYYSYDLPGKHGYAPGWYAGSADPNLTNGQTVGQYWSPLLPANSGSSNPVPGLASYYQQNWTYFFHSADQQFVLNPATAPTETITFASLGAAPVTVTQDGTINQSQPISLRAPYYGQSGISFDYQFPAYQPGDRLIILADGKPAFAMDAALVSTHVEHATLSLSALPCEAHSLTFILTSTTANTTSQVTVSNFQTFEQPVFSSV
jgi:hypothetical protein